MKDEDVRFAFFLGMFTGFAWGIVMAVVVVALP